MWCSVALVYTELLPVGVVEMATLILKVSKKCLIFNVGLKFSCGKQIKTLDLKNMASASQQSLRAVAETQQFKH